MVVNIKQSVKEKQSIFIFREQKFWINHEDKGSGIGTLLVDDKERVSESQCNSIISSEYTVSSDTKWSYHYSEFQCCSKLGFECEGRGEFWVTAMQWSVQIPESLVSMIFLPTLALQLTIVLDETRDRGTIPGVKCPSINRERSSRDGCGSRSRSVLYQSLYLKSQ